MRIGPHTWYSGAPEADGFKGHAAAGVLLVEIDAPGADPRVEQIPLGLYQWHRIEAGFFAGHDPVKVLEEALPKSDRELALVRFVGTGRLRVSRIRTLTSSHGSFVPESGSFQYHLCVCVPNL